MDVSWLTCRPNDRQKMPSLLPEPRAIAVSEIAALSGHDADIPKSTQMNQLGSQMVMRSPLLRHSLARSVGRQ